MARETVRDLLVGRLSEGYCAEHHALRAHMSAATHERLVELLGDHLDAVGWNLDCLDEVFAVLREGSCSAACDDADGFEALNARAVVGDAARAPVAMTVPAAALEAAARKMRAA